MNQPTIPNMIHLIISIVVVHSILIQCMMLSIALKKWQIHRQPYRPQIQRAHIRQCMQHRQLLSVGI